MRKAVFVVGPESSGTRMMTKFFMSCGYEGDHGHSQPWDDMKFRGYPDRIVFRQSVPHGERWPDIVGIIQKLQMANYVATAVVTWRDPVCMAHSQHAAAHVTSKEQALDNIARAIIHCDTAFGELGWTPLTIKYGEFVGNEEYRKALHGLFTSVGYTPFEVYDGNNKWRGLERLNERGLTAVTKAIDNALHIRF